MRAMKFQSGGFYHIYNRGVDKRTVFMNNSDYFRFMISLSILNNIDQKQIHGIRKSQFKQCQALNPYIRIHSYCLMPNHYHLLVEQVADKGVSNFMQRLGDSYTIFFNTKHDRSGHLFEGPYKVKSIEKTSALLHTSRYIHANPRKLCNTGNQWEFVKNYKWSSFQNYLDPTKRSFVETNYILEYFSSPEDYARYVLDYVNNSETFTKP
ncbi:transposase [Patescibacteria group bacterium]|nr:transposase [Patescibacteria group bacterium]